MFDQNDQNQQQAQAPANEPMGAPAPDTTMTSGPATDPAGAPMPAIDNSGFNATVMSAPAPDNTSVPSFTPEPTMDTQAVSQPVSEPTPIETPSMDMNMGMNMTQSDTTDLSPSSEPTASSPTPTSDGANDDLMSIKKDALQNLTPLLGQLEQSAEEKFRTTMMLIQASDDQSLIQTAYAAAKDIEDEKVRAQALLDVVNEINYFTQQAKSE